MSNEFIWETPTPFLGVNNTYNDRKIADGELSDAANYQPDFTGQGGLIKREGITKHDANQRAATSYSIHGGLLGNYYHNGTVVYTFDGTSRLTGMAAAYDSWTSMALGSTSYDMFVNGTDAQKSSNGTSFSAIANIPAGVKYICAANNFVYAAGHSGGKIRYADYATIETWHAVNELDVSRTIVGLLKCDNALGAWSTNAFYMVMGYSNIDQEISYYSEKDGCVGSHRSIVSTPYGVFWWGLPGIVWMKSGYSIDYPMHRKLAKTLAGLNRAYDSLVHASWDATQQRVIFWLVTGAGTTINSAVAYYPGYDSFYPLTGAGTYMSVSAPVRISGAENVYVSGYNPTYLYKMSGLTDDGTAIAGYLETKREGNPLVYRNANTVSIATDLTGTETLEYKCYVDGASTATRTVSLAIAAGSVDTDIGLNLRNKRIKHRISDSATATRTRIIGITHSGQIDKVK